MEIHSTKNDLPKGKPIAEYPKLLLVAIFRSYLPMILIWLAMFWISTQITKGNIASVLIILIGVMGIIFVIWHTRNSKIEQYSDAIVIYSPFRRDVIFLDEIEDLILEFNGSSRRRTLLDGDPPSIGFTRYGIKHRGGSIVYFSDEYQSYEEIVEQIKERISQVDGALPRMINRLNAGEKITFLHFIVTKEGITSENGEFRAWSQLRLFPAEYPRKQRLAERYKKPATNKLIIWAILPTRRSIVFDGLVEHFIEPY